jgi:hypothetical protein
MAKKRSAKARTEITSLAAAQADEADPADLDLAAVLAPNEQSAIDSLSAMGQAIYEMDEGVAELISARNELIQRLGGSLMEAHAGAGAASLSAPAADPLSALNIQAIGAGLRKSSGSYTGELAVKIYVLRKVRESALPAELRIPAEINGIPTDVQEVDQFFAQAGFPGRYPRPVPCGCQLGE